MMKTETFDLIFEKNTGNSLVSQIEFSSEDFVLNFELPYFDGKVLLVCDENTEAYADKNASFKKLPRIVLKSGEKQKTMENVIKIATKAADLEFHRCDTFVALGGGVICDLTAFAASIYMRGINLFLVPTTLLAMVDAGIGGKTACDFLGHKNLLGTFSPAQKIYIFTSFLKTLSPEEFRSGLGEVLKTGLLGAPKVYQILQTQKDDILERNNEILFQIIKRCVQAKARFVQSDLTEKGVRTQLNFGHTFSHALENLLGFGKVLHGDAVAWGISRALEVSATLSMCKAEYRDEVFAVLNDYGWCTDPCYEAIKDKKDFPHKLMGEIKSDKKQQSNKIRLVLQRGMNINTVEEVAEETVLDVLR